LTEKDGWLHLGAYGFTFSSPVLHVKFKQGNSSSSTKSNKNGHQGFSITCVKGKVIKNIIAAKPICPSGWKKK